MFTPPALADLLARLSAEVLAAGPVLDPACGDGRLLVAVAARRHTAGIPAAESLAGLIGWDVDPAAVWTARAALVGWALEHATPDEALPDLSVERVDALSETGPPADLEARCGAFGEGVAAVVANPPYLEAKRMAGPHRALRRRLRERLDLLHGAWDLYLAFTALALRWVRPGGHVALVLPNKVLQARYAARLRAHLLDGAEGWRLRGLVDLSTCQPRPFPGTGVYPVVVHLVRDGAERPIRAARIATPDQIRAPAWTPVRPAVLGRVGGEHPWFVPRSTWSALEPLFDGPRLADVAAVRSTCSFHVRGLRERFVTPERPDDPQAHPYLGGPSRTRRTEVGCFRVRWAGWWIRFDQRALREDHRNPLPPLETFARPKVILCQHGRRVRPVVDREGRWVTKDVYPVAFPEDPAWDLDALAAVLASTVFTALYNTVFHGIVCGGETFHYLPVFLGAVPVPADPAALSPAAARVAGLHREGPVDRDAWEALDRDVARAYGVDEAARRHLVEEHLARVGAEGPYEGGTS